MNGYQNKYNEVSCKMSPPSGRQLTRKQINYYWKAEALNKIVRKINEDFTRKNLRAEKRERKEE